MDYELSSLLSAITGASATIVAIIGGFIASKLISLSSERAEIEMKSFKIHNELALLKKNITIDQNKLDEENALTFIYDNIENLIAEKCLSKEYEDIRKPDDLSYEKLLEFWGKALTVYRRLKVSVENANKFNDDNIPVDLAKELQNEFDYEVCKIVAQEIMQQSINSSFPINCAFKAPRLTGIWYRDLKNNVSNMNAKVEWLNIQSEQLSIRERALKKPKGMVLGLLLLIFFSITGIVLPVFHINIATCNFQIYSKLRNTFIALLCINLILTFLYFIYLLHWKKH